jgi:hypothetical protein
MPGSTSLALLLLLTLGLTQMSFQQSCSSAGCSACSNNSCISCNGAARYYPQINTLGFCDLCPTGCDTCLRNGTAPTLICTKCTNVAQYPVSGTTTCQSCPEGCSGCQSINGKASCLKCADGFTRKSEGLILTCSKNLAWWAWLLIALAIAVVLAGIIVAIVMSTKKKTTVQRDPYGNPIEMSH